MFEAELNLKLCLGAELHWNLLLDVNFEQLLAYIEILGFKCTRNPEMKNSAALVGISYGSKLYQLPQ